MLENDLIMRDFEKLWDLSIICNRTINRVISTKEKSHKVLDNNNFLEHVISP
jgi:hypothetical protein